MSFASFHLRPELLRALAARSLTTPTAIQEKAIPPACAGRDLLACAETGSGKTLAFLLPILHRLAGRTQRATRALVLAPTRELAAQIDAERAAIGRYTSLDGVPIVGGVSMAPQIAALRRRVDVVVATPGRLLDLFRDPTCRLHTIDVLVLDEADRMLDMGFLPDVRRIVASLGSGRRQTLLFSATLAPAVAKLAEEWLHDPVSIGAEARVAPVAGVRHRVYRVARDRKVRLLLDVLRQPHVHNVLAFTRTKHRADRLATALGRSGVAADRIHGDRSQAQRTKALADFKAGRLRVLVATDIAARGIDVAGLSHVVNFDVPDAPESYVHRVGRTARAGAIGDALTFVAPEEAADFGSIERAIGCRMERTVAPTSAP